MRFLIMVTKRDQVLRTVRERIVGFAASRVGADFAEDVAQEVLLLLETKYPHLESLEDLLPLSVQIVKYKAMSLRRRHGREGARQNIPIEDVQLSDGRVSAYEELERSEMAERLIGAVKKLGHRCQELFRLKLEGENYESIRLKLGANTLATIYTWDFRCRQQLLEICGGKWEGRQRDNE